ncbi:lipase-like domain-containing protein, partial [Staphylococcus epidermidis]
NHLTTQPPQKINQQTTLNPNILYTTYTPSPTHTPPLPNQLPNSTQILLFNLTTPIIPKHLNKQITPNHPLLPLISSQH